MRGSVQYTDFMNMSYMERKLISDISKENMEITQKTQLNYF